MELRTYEGLFLIDPTVASQDWDGIKNKVLEMLTRRGGEIISAKKWGERKLAYEIKGHKRGTYLLVYFKMPPENVQVVRRDIQLAELVLRTMIIVYERPIKETPEEGEEAAQKAESADSAQAEAGEEKAQESSKETEASNK